MGHAAGHLSEGAQALVLHDDLLGAAQLIVSFAHALRKADLIVEVAALLLGGDYFALQGVLLGTDGCDFLQHLLVFIAHLFEHQHDHAHGDEELQHGGHKKSGAVKIVILLRNRVTRQIHTPEEKPQRKHARPHKRHLASKAVKADAGENTADPQQNENRQLNL